MIQEIVQESLQIQFTTARISSFRFSVTLFLGNEAYGELTYQNASTTVSASFALSSVGSYGIGRYGTYCGGSIAIGSALDMRKG